MSAINITKEQFDRYASEGKTVLVDYWAPWCGYCRRIGPAYEKAAEQHENSIIFAKVNIDEEPQLAHAENIEVIPTLVLYKAGKPISTIVAPDSKAKIEAFLQESLSE